MSNSLKASGLEFAGVLDGERYVFIADFITFVLRMNLFDTSCFCFEMHDE